MREYYYFDVLNQLTNFKVWNVDRHSFIKYSLKYIYFQFMGTQMKYFDQKLKFTGYLYNLD